MHTRTPFGSKLDVLTPGHTHSCFVYSLEILARWPDWRLAHVQLVQRPEREKHSDFR